MTTSNKNQADIGSEARKIIGRVVRPMVGPRCKTHYRDDFPNDDLKEGEGCLACNIYDEVDKAVAEISALLNKLVGEELQNILDNASGGGNWRRIINLRLQELTNPGDKK